MLLAGIAIIVCGLIWSGKYSKYLDRYKATHDTTTYMNGWYFDDAATYKAMEKVQEHCLDILFLSGGWAIVVGIMILAAKESFIRTYIWGTAVITLIMLLCSWSHSDDAEEYDLEYLISGKLLTNAIVFLILAIIVYFFLIGSKGVQEHMRAHNRKAYVSKSANTYTATYDPNPSRLAKAAQQKKEEEILRNGGWRCAFCNNLNASYIGTCSCGKTRSQHDDKIRQNALYKEELRKSQMTKDDNSSDSTKKVSDTSVTNTVNVSPEKPANIITEKKQPNNDTAASQSTDNEPVLCTADPEGYPMYFLPNGYPYYLNSDNQKYYYCENGRLIYYDENGDTYYPF